jgi:hypothetical protein
MEKLLQLSRGQLPTKRGKCEHGSGAPVLSGVQHVRHALITGNN